MLRRFLCGAALVASVASCADDSPAADTRGATPADTPARPADDSLPVERGAGTTTIDDGTIDDGTIDDGVTPGPVVQPAGFTTVTARITEADGEVCDVCLWLADSAEERARGLMGVTDLGDAVGMAFAFDESSAGAFYMFQTPTPLSIAWFGRDGALVGTADMPPCLDTPADDCPRYAPDGSFVLAVEVFDGDLEPLGIGPGSTVVLLDGTESERCPTP